MDKNQIEVKPLTAGMAPSQSPTRTYFFERPDGSVIHVTEQAAWSLYARPQQTLHGRIRFKYLGTSDGLLYAQAVDEASVIFKEQGLEAAQEHLRKALEEEKAQALLNRTPPRDFDTVDSGGNPVDLRTLR